VRSSAFGTLVRSWWLPLQQHLLRQILQMQVQLTSVCSTANTSHDCATTSACISVTSVRIVVPELDPHRVLPLANVWTHVLQAAQSGNGH